MVCLTLPHYLSTIYRCTPLEWHTETQIKCSQLQCTTRHLITLHHLHKYSLEYKSLFYTVWGVMPHTLHYILNLLHQPHARHTKCTWEVYHTLGCHTSQVYHSTSQTTTWWLNAIKALKLPIYYNPKKVWNRKIKSYITSTHPHHHARHMPYIKAWHHKPWYYTPLYFTVYHHSRHAMKHDLPSYWRGYKLPQCHTHSQPHGRQMHTHQVNGSNKPTPHTHTSFP